MKGIQVLLLLSICHISLSAQFISRILPADSAGLKMYSQNWMFDVDSEQIGLVLTRFDNSSQKHQLWKYLLRKSNLTILDSVLLHTSLFTGRQSEYVWEIFPKEQSGPQIVLLERNATNGDYAISGFIGDKYWDLGNRIFHRTIQDSVFRVRYSIIDDDLYYSYCRGLQPWGEPTFCEIIKVHLPSQSITQKTLMDFNNQISISVPHWVLPYPNDPALITLTNNIFSNVTLLNKSTLDTVQKIWIDAGKLMIDFNLWTPRWSKGHAFEKNGDLIIAGTASYNLGAPSFASSPRCYCLTFDSNFDIVDGFLFGEISPSANTGCFGLNLMSDSTRIVTGSTPIIDNFSTLTNSQILVGKYSKFGRDSLLIYGQSTHTAFQALDDSISGDLFILSQFRAPLPNNVFYLEVIKIPQFAISVLEQQQLARGLRLYPNPTTDFLDLADAAGLRGSPNWRIFDSQGREVRTGIWSGSKIDVQQLAKGSYVLLMEADGQIFNTVFVKQ